MQPQRISLFLTLLLWCIAALAAAPEASVDRAVVNEGDSITLTIRRAGDSDERPDYSALAQDFHVYGSSESNRHVVSNGRAESWSEWQTTLIPKRRGSLTIPPIAVGNAKTNAIAIRVKPAPQQAGSSDQPLFIEANIDSESVYVQQQLLLTVRIFHAIRLDDMNLTEPELDSAQIEKVGQESFRRDIDGVTYQVHELVYAIFPREPGELTIPELVFSARQPLRTRSFFDFPGQGAGLRRLTPQFTVRVKPIPPQFSGGVWLPARNLTLLESWSEDPQQLTVGESATRSLTVQADGLPAAQLPELAVPDLSGARLYADQPQLDNLGDARGLHGKRTQSMALIPTAPGTLQLPAVRVRWWDVVSDSEKVAELPMQRLAVQPAAAGADASQLPAPTALMTTTTEPAAANANANGALWGWQLAATVLGTAWLITLVMWWRGRQPTPEPAPAVNTRRTENERQHFLALEHHCRSGDATRARQTLLHWAANYYHTSPITLAQLATRSGNAELAQQIGLLEHHLFSGDTEAWKGKALFDAVAAVRTRREPVNDKGGALPPLYPTG